ncbi:hypothetical protein ABHF33_02760 [Chitinibacter sp. FCG-7]|uniref:Uncharacterized protein n=1 Tax=Chitinibacter mangrovi TaxID=3153927 RepID=A0AAU7FC36_9NEIS
MNSRLDQKAYERFVKGFYISDCVILNKDEICFILEEYYISDDIKPKDELVTRIIQHTNRIGTPAWKGVELEDLSFTRAGASLLPIEQFVAVSRNDFVYALGSGDDDFEDDLVNGRSATGAHIGMRGALTRLRTIDGELWVTATDCTV